MGCWFSITGITQMEYTKSFQYLEKLRQNIIWISIKFRLMVGIFVLPGLVMKYWLNCRLFHISWWNITIPLPKPHGSVPCANQSNNKHLENRPQGKRSVRGAHYDLDQCISVAVRSIEWVLSYFQKIFQMTLRWPLGDLETRNWWK